MQQLDKAQIVTVFMTVRVNELRLVDEPPLLRTEIANAAIRQAVENTVKLGAKHWDMYRDVVQLSFYADGTYTHFMLCGDHDADGQGDPQANRVLYVFDDEEELMRAVASYICNLYGATPEGRVLRQALMVGWRMSGEIWPVIVNRAIKYRLPLPRDMLVAPDVKWPNGHYIGDLANIYMQGGAGQRALPGLADALRFWGYWDDEHRPLPEDIETAVCDDPVGTAAAIELYLKDMHDMLCVYTRGNTGQEPVNPLVGAPVPPWSNREFS